MGKRIQDAIGAAKEWLGDVNNETLVNLATAFAAMALASEDEDVPGILRSAIAALKKFRSKESKEVIARIEQELEMGWPVRKGPQKLVPLM